MAQGTLRSPIGVYVSRRKVTLLRLHGEVDIPVKAIHTVKKLSRLSGPYGQMTKVSST